MLSCVGTDGWLHKALDKELEMAARIGGQRPAIDFLSYRTKGQRGLGTRKGFEHGALFLHACAPPRRTNGAHILEGDIQKSVVTLVSLAKRLRPSWGVSAMFARTRNG